MTLDVVDVTDRPPLGHDEAMALQATELERSLDLLRTVDGADWATTTECCPDWDVRELYLHLLGACEASASMRENLHQMRKAFSYRRRHGVTIDVALPSVQVRDRADLSPEALVERFTATAPVTVRKRSKMPGLMRRMPMKVDGPVVETWRFGYLVDTIYLRDLWIHRVDAAVTLDRAPVLTADHDGRIVADAVAEWARRHGQPFSLVLDGPAGGAYEAAGRAENAEQLHLDAVEFCQTLAGREERGGLLATVVPF